VIAGEARATLDIRHASDGARTEALDELIRHAESIAARRGRDREVAGRSSPSMPWQWILF